MPAWPRLRRPWRLLAAAVLVPPASYLVAANLFLNTALGPWIVNRGPAGRPGRVHLAWDSGWSLLPGRFVVRGLTVRGQGRRLGWSVTAERGRGRVALSGLFRREVLVTGFRAEGGRLAVEGLPASPGEPAPGAPAPLRRRPWRVALPGLEVGGLRRLAYGSLALEGEGIARGSFAAMGGEVSFADGSLSMRGTRLLAGGEETARDLEMEAAWNLAPYRPREHPGTEGFDFLTGSLRARGRMAEATASAVDGTPAGAAEPGSFDADLRVEGGRLLPGSRFTLASRSGYPLTIEAAVEGRAERDQVLVAIAAQNFRLGPRAGLPPLLAGSALRITTATPETRLSRLFSEAQALQEGEGPRAAALPGEFVAEALRLDLRGDRLSCWVAADGATGIVDLAALFRRHLVVHGMRGEGAEARLEVAKERDPAAPPGGKPWAVRMTDARFAGVRSIGMGELRLEGEAEAETTFVFHPEGGLEVRHAAFTLPAGRLLEGEELAARAVSVRAQGRAEPVDLSNPAPAAGLAALSGSVEVRAEVPSLGFLRDLLRPADYLGLDGKGRLVADLRVEGGRLAPGTRLSVRAAHIETQILGSRAEGRGTVEAAVAEGPEGSRLVVRARLERFAFHDAANPAYLRGRDLEFRAFSAEALRLGARPADLRAEVDLPDAVAPDLSVFGGLLPPGAGVSILDGSGHLRLRLAVVAANHTAEGEVALTSEGARIAIQDLELAGRMAISARLRSPDLLARRFDLDGTRLDLDPVTYREVGEEAAEELRSWWARSELTDATVVWGEPLSLSASARVAMKDSGLLVALFSRRRHYLRWFEQALRVEDVTAQGRVRLDQDGLAIEALRAEGGDLELASRLRFSKSAKEGDLFLRHGRFAVGIEMRDGKRDLKLLRPREWLASWWGQALSP